MLKLKERYIVDEKGNRVGVILDIEDYRKLLAELEELESICAYDAAKASGEEAIPFEQAVAEIERKRANNIELPPAKPIKEMRGFLKGIDTTIKRDPDRI